MADPVGAKVVKDNKSGEEVVERRPVTPNESSPGVTPLDIDADLLAADINAAVDKEFAKLQGGREDVRNINWFGGSYSGQDMKVVAHLYESTKNDEEIAKLQHDVQVAERIRDGADALVNGGITTLAAELDPTWDYERRKETFLAAAGPWQKNDDVDEEASRFLVVNIFNGSRWGTFLGIAKTKKKAEQIKNGHTALAKSLQDRLDSLTKIQGKGMATVVLATLQTLSVQSHREKFAVRALGHSYVKGYTRGPRTIAGSMIFTVFNEHALAHLTRSLGKSSTYGEKDGFMKTLLPDQLPPLDLTIAFANEYGSISEMRLYGVEFINDGATYSIEDLMTENVINFVARDADPMTAHGNIKLHRDQAGMRNEFGDIGDLSGSKLLFDDENYKEYLTRLGMRRRLKNR